MLWLRWALQTAHRHFLSAAFLFLPDDRMRVHCVTLNVDGLQLKNGCPHFLSFSLLLLITGLISFILRAVSLLLGKHIWVPNKDQYLAWQREKVAREEKITFEKSENTACGAPPPPPPALPPEDLRSASAGMFLPRVGLGLWREAQPASSGSWGAGEKLALSMLRASNGQSRWDFRVRRKLEWSSTSPTTSGTGRKSILRVYTYSDY